LNRAFLVAAAITLAGCGSSSPASMPNPSMPDAMPNPSMPDAKPSPSMPDAKPSPSMPDAMPSPSMPDAMPNPSIPDAGPPLAMRVQQAAETSKAAMDWQVGLVVGAITPTEQVIYYVGERSIGQGAPDGMTAFRLGSLTKTVTAALLALQNDNGLYVGPCSGPEPGKSLTLLAPTLAAACPTCAALPTERSTITMQDLATHYSGLPTVTTKSTCTVDDVYQALTDCSVSDIGAHPMPNCVASDCPSFCASTNCDSTCNACRPPGSYLYSNWGFAVLGGLVAFHAGDTWEHLVQTALTTPLGMTHTFVDGASTGGAVEASGYNCTTTGCVVEPVLFPTSENPAGGLWSTGPDMMRYLAFAMGQGGNTSTQALYAARSLMFCTRAGAMGLGWLSATLNGATTSQLSWGKPGDFGGFSSYLGFLPKSGVGAFALSNGGPMDGPMNLVKALLSTYVP
jgi:CubicO group peptidase (beta-lactamase class C family)